MHVMQLLGTGHKNKILVSSSPGPTQSTLLGIKGAIHLNAIFPPLDTALIFFFRILITLLNIGIIKYYKIQIQDININT